MAGARPRQSYILARVPVLVVNVTAWQVFATTSIAAWLPVRASPGAWNP